MSVRRRWIRAALSLTFLASLLLFAAPAAAQNGGISGTVTSAAPPFSPIGNVQIVVFDAAGTYVNAAPTNGLGVYTVPNLPEGSNYFVRTIATGDSNFINELYDDIRCVPNCTVTDGQPVTVTVGVTAGIDFALSPGGSITGTVTEAVNNTALSGVSIFLYNSAGVFAGNTSSATNGTFTIGALPPGSYFAITSLSNSQNYLNEAYNNVPCNGSCSPRSGTAISVSAGAATNGINFGLSPGGGITGIVTDAVTHAPLAGVFIRIYDAGGNSVSSVSTNGSGVYTVSHLSAGPYFVRTSVQGSQNYVNELYDNFACMSCDPTSGTAVAVTTGATTSGINFALAGGGQITGVATDAVTQQLLKSVEIDVWRAEDGTLVNSTSTSSTGAYTISGLPSGSYYVSALYNNGSSGLAYVGKLYGSTYFPDISGGQNNPKIDVTSGTPVSVTAGGAAIGGIDFALTPGGRITGTVTDATTNSPLAGVLIKVYTASGTFVAFSFTESSGTFQTTGIPVGSNVVRTSVTAPLNYIDELYDNLPCAGCDVTTGTPVAVTVNTTTSGINFALMPMNLVQNGGFSNGTTGWKLFGAPNDAYMVSNTTGGSFNFRRTPQPGGTPVSQATLFQDTGIALPSNTPMLAQFDLANTASKVMVMRVLLVADSTNFGLDFAACTFALPADGVARTYGMKAHTTQAWPNAAIYFYATQIDANGGDYYYKVDNVTLQQAAGQSVERTECVDSAAPGTPGGANSANLLVNGDFSSGALAPGWGEAGAITGRSPMVGGVYEFLRTAPFPPAVVLQQTNPTLAPAGQIPIGQRLTLTLKLGNSGPGRKRALVLVNDNDFSSFVACAWWLAPNQALTTFAMQLYTTEAWENPAVSIYPSSGATDQWLRLDDVVLKKTPAATNSGPVCLEGAEAAAVATALGAAPPAGPPSMQGEMFAVNTFGAPPASSLMATAGEVARAVPPSPDDDPLVAPDDTWTATSDGWEATAAETASRVLQWKEPIDLTHAIEARLTFESQLTALDSRAEVQVSRDGGFTWITVSRVTPTDTWQLVEIDLDGFLGEVIEVRFLLDAVAPPAPTTPDVWRVREIDLR